MEVEVEYIKEQMQGSAPTSRREKRQKNQRQKKLQLMISLKWNYE